MRATYGVSVVMLISDSLSATVFAVSNLLLRWIKSHYNGNWLYIDIYMCMHAYICFIFHFLYKYINTIYGDVKAWNSLHNEGNCAFNRLVAKWLVSSSQTAVMRTVGAVVGANPNKPMNMVDLPAIWDAMPLALRHCDSISIWNIWHIASNYYVL